MDVGSVHQASFEQFDRAASLKDLASIIHNFLERDIVCP